MIRPLQDRVLVERVEAEDKTASGIIIPDTAKEKPQEGKVVAVGPGKRLDNGSIQEMGVKKGDKILFSKYGGTEVKVDGEDYIICLLYTSPSPRDRTRSRMPSSA